MGVVSDDDTMIDEMEERWMGTEELIGIAE
jgi:hypothetical protein